MNDKTKAEMIDFIVTWRATHGGSISEHNHRRLLRSWSTAEVRKLYAKIQVGEVGASQAEAPKPDRSLPDKFDETPDEQYGGVPSLEYRKGWNAAIDESARLAATPSDALLLASKRVMSAFAEGRNPTFDEIERLETIITGIELSSGASPSDEQIEKEAREWIFSGNLPRTDYTPERDAERLAAFYKHMSKVGEDSQS